MNGKENPPVLTLFCKSHSDVIAGVCPIASHSKLTWLLTSCGWNSTVVYSYRSNLGSIRWWCDSAGCAMWPHIGGPILQCNCVTMCNQHHCIASCCIYFWHRRPSTTWRASRNQGATSWLGCSCFFSIQYIMIVCWQELSRPLTTLVAEKLQGLAIWQKATLQAVNCWKPESQLDSKWWPCKGRVQKATRSGT